MGQKVIFCSNFPSPLPVYETHALVMYICFSAVKSKPPLKSKDFNMCLFFSKGQTSSLPEVYL